MTTSRREARLREFLERVWSQGEAGACAEFLADIYVIHHDPGDPWEGRSLDLAGFEDRLRRSRAPFPDQRFTVLGVFAGADALAVTWSWRATHLGDLPGFPASGRTITMTGATVYGFDAADRLTGHWQVVDRLGVYRQLQGG